jgi:hypothetical protein
LSEQHSPQEDDDWLEPTDELPPRARRRLLSPASLALLGVLLTACGFIGGVLVEKGQASSSSTSAGGTANVISRSAALRAGASSSGTGPSGAGAGSRELSGLGSGAGRPVSGQVAYLQGSTLYLTESEGNTVKVRTSPATSVTKTVPASVKGIHPGETVTVAGATGSNGSVNAESIRVGSLGSGLSALFGGAARSAGTPPAAAGGGPALFGGG